MERSSNPALSDDVFTWFSTVEGDPVMTLQGVTWKTTLFLITTIFGAILSWNFGSEYLYLMWPLIISTFVVSVIITMKQHWASILWFVYALFEWFLLWIISLYFEIEYPWIVLQTIGATIWVFVTMLFLYSTKIIKPTSNFKLWVISATGWIMVLYLISLLWSFTQWYTIGFIFDSGPIWILFSLFVVWLAALNLVLDFDFIEEWVNERAPKYMEWYAAFWLLVTLIWLYLELLRLISKLRD